MSDLKAKLGRDPTPEEVANKLESDAEPDFIAEAVANNPTSIFGDAENPWEGLANHVTDVATQEAN